MEDTVLGLAGGTIWTTVIGGAGVLIAAVVLFQWSYWVDMIRYRNKLPKGSYGWPVIGETIALMTTDPMKFAKPRVAKYGKMFKTHLYGDPTIIITSPELGRALNSKPYDELHLTGPPGSQKLMGERAMQFLSDKDHEALHKLVQSYFFLPSLMAPRIPHIERVINNQLSTWDGKTVNSLEEFRKMAGNLTARMLLGFEHGDDDHYITELMEIFGGPYYRGFYQIPINFPGSGYNKGLKAREQIAQTMDYLINKWEKSSKEGKAQDCLLHRLIEHREPTTGELMSRKAMIDNMILLIFAGFDTSASTFAMTLKHLWENPKVHETIKAEHAAIAKRKSPGEPLSLAEINDMKYTDQVFRETLRYPGPVPLSFRVTESEVQIDGYTIPKGWKMVNLFTFNQQDSSLFSNPTVFDPSRFSEISAKGFSPFGGGRHLCPGREQSKVTFKLVMHHLLTKYSWEPVNYQPGYAHFPVLMTSPKGGFPIAAHRIKDAQA